MLRRMGVEATAGRLEIKGESRIMFNNGAGNYGVKVGESVTSATLTGAMIRGEGSGTGVYVENGAGVGATGTLNMDDVTIKDVAMGVLMKGTGMLTMNKGEITFKSGTNNYGIGVWGDGGATTANITGTRITGGGSGQGMGVWMKEAGTLNMTGVNISGVAMMEAKAVRISGGSMTGVQTGITMSGSGTLTVNKGTRIEFTGNYGIGVGGEVTMAELTNVMITGSGNGTGVYVENGAGEVTLNMDDVHILNVGTGVWVSRGTLTMNNGSIGFKNGDGNGKGLSIEGTATATITGTTIRGMDGQGKGVLMNGTGKLVMERVTISDVEKGVEATAGNLTINGHSRIEFTGSGHGVKVGSGV
ncbi:hypothetical protein, partial [Bartonella bovis]|uniref:hypothetical protein n=1 Tax=Bartonella bovis TaxID=155194 RepID=UPI0011AF83AF